MNLYERAVDRATDYGYARAGGSDERAMISESFRDGYKKGAMEQADIILKVVNSILEDLNMKVDERLFDEAIKNTLK